METYIVLTKANDAEEVVVRTLLGEYVEQGTNHGRKVYKKSAEKGGEAVEVFLYYWDGRDGAAFEGWWFGNKLGGTQVWSHCTSNGLHPPCLGWKIPWDGSARPTLMCVSKAEQQKNDTAERMKTINGEISGSWTTAKMALEQAKAAAGNYSEAAGLQSAEGLLQPMVGMLNDALKKLADCSRGITGDAAKQATHLGAQLRATQNGVNTELAKLRASKAKAEQSEKQKAAEEKDMALFQEVLPEAVQKTNAAEDAVEKAVITSEMITVGGDDMEEVKQAVTQTEQASQEAQKAIGEARIYLNAKQAASRRYESDKVKQLASTELTKLQTQLQDAQEKLNPLKNVRQDFTQRQAVQKLVAEVMARLVPAEVDCDKAEEATMLLASEGQNAEMLQRADKAMKNAVEQVSGVTKFLEQKKKQAAAASFGSAMSEFSALEERVKASEKRLTQLKMQHKEAAERVSCEGVMREATDKLLAVQEHVLKAAETEAPFLMGVEELPLEETLAAVKACETAATSANTSVSIARMFIATKMVEAKRFSPNPSQEAQTKLKELQKQLEESTKKLSDLKTATAKRKATALSREAEHEVAQVEDMAKKLVEAALVFKDEEKLKEMTSDEIKAAADETTQAEVEVNERIAETRKFITQRQIEAKVQTGKTAPGQGSTELIKYQTRLSAAQSEVAKHKKLAGIAVQRLPIKKLLEDINKQIKEAEELVEKAVSLVGSLSEEDKGSEAVLKEAETTAAEASMALKKAGRHLETQMRQQPLAKEDIAKLVPVVQKAQDKLDAAATSMRGQKEQILVKGIIAESETRVVEAEKCVKEALTADEPLQKATDDTPIEEAASALEALETAIQAAHTAIGGTKTFIAIKRLAAKRLAESVATTASEELGKLQTRLDDATKKLGEIKKGLPARKASILKRDMTAKIAEVGKLLEAAQEATKTLVEGGGGVSTEIMKGACEKAGTAQGAASTAIDAARKMLLSRQKDAKANPQESSMLADITKFIEEVGASQAVLDKLKGQLRDEEHKFVASRLLKDASDMVTNLEGQLETTTTTATPLVSDDSEKFAASCQYLMDIVEALKQNAKANSKTTAALFDDIGESGKISEAAFVSFLGKIPELLEGTDPLFTDEELKAAFSRIDKKAAGELAKEEFLNLFQGKYVCTTIVSMTDSLAVKDGKAIRKLELNEVVELLEEPTKDEAAGLVRAKARAEKDAKEGYVTMSGNQGTVYLEKHSPYTVCEKLVNQAVQELIDATTTTVQYIDKKIEELKAVKAGPLAETKTELLKLKPRVVKVKAEQAQLRKQVGQAQKKHAETIEAEKKRRQEAVDRRASKRMLDDAAEAMNAVQEKVDKHLPAAEALCKSGGADLSDPLQAMGQSQKDLEATMEVIATALNTIKESHDEIKSNKSRPFTEARSAFVKHKVKLDSWKSKCQTQIAALRTAHKKVTDDAHAAVTSALRAHVRKEEMSADAVWKQLSDGSPGSISVASIRGFVEKMPEDKRPKASQLDLGFNRYSAGISRLGLLEMLQEYLKCVKEIAITTNFGVKDGKTIRKLAVGETVEVLEDSKMEEQTGVHRVKCRAIRDGKEGWATLKGNQGTPYLEACVKPYYSCAGATILGSAFESNSSEVKKVQAGEVLELLEGPMKEPALETTRVRGRAGNDKKGWVTLKDAQGTTYLELAKLYVCKQSIAITTAFDIAEGKAIRKLQAGECLECLEDPTEDSKRGLSRMKAKTKSDNKEGWVTVKGNQGTSYTEESEKHYICKRSMPIESRSIVDSKALATLEEGEVFEVLDAPKAEIKEGSNRAKGRTLSDGTEGWFTLTTDGTRPWSPYYVCAQGTAINDAVGIKESKTVRKVEEGETLEALELPVLEETAGVMRVKVRAEKDGATGFATVRGNQGTVILKPKFDL